MRECSNCGASVREGAKFCTSCGTRLNDAAPADQINSWALTDTDATVVATAVTSTGNDDTSPSSDPDPVAEEVQGSAETGSFAWTWGSAASTNAEEGVPGDDGSAPPPVDDDDAAVEPPPVETELDVVAVDSGESEEADATPAPSGQEPAEDLTTPEALDSTDDGDDATLAAWAGQWSDDDATATIDHTAPEAPAESVDDSDVDAVARAEQLLDELKRIIPSLARPRGLEPGANAEGNTGLLSTAGFMEDLGEPGESESFDDLRDTIEAAQANPRDVDSMLKLAANAERLRELLDDRDRLAGKLTSIRERLKAQATGRTE